MVKITSNNFLLLLLVVELLYLVFSLTRAPFMLMVTIAFPALFIVPGFMFLTILKPTCLNLLQRIVEGFFLSTLIVVILTSAMMALGIPLAPLYYSLETLVIVLILTLIGSNRQLELAFDKADLLQLAIVFIVYVVLIFYLGTLPRLFANDETSYIFSARLSGLTGAIPPVGVNPNWSAITALLGGRYFWVNLLSSFISSTNSPTYQAGLLSVAFLVMTALASSLFLKTRWFKIAVFLFVAINPLLFLFSALSLNDLALSFYAVFAVLFFMKSFSKDGKSISISIINLSFSLISVVVLTLIKPNLLVFVAIWLLLMYVLLRYRLHKQSRKYRFLLIVLAVPVLSYELFLDLPYVIAVWGFHNSAFGNIFQRFLFISPLEHILGWFAVPWFNPTGLTLFAHGFPTFIYYLYRILSPESLGLLISAIILALPVLIISRNIRKELDITVLASITLLSTLLFWFDAVNTFNIADAGRYSLWMVPIFLVLVFMVLEYIYYNSAFKQLVPILIAAAIFLLFNIWLSYENHGIIVGYAQLSSVFTSNILLSEFVAMLVLVGLLFFREKLSGLTLIFGKRKSTLKAANLKKMVFVFLMIVLLFNGVYFASQFVEGSTLFVNHDFETINKALSDSVTNGTLVFANNYNFMRTYESAAMFKQGSILPLPSTEQEFLDLLTVAPNNTIILISADAATNWFQNSISYVSNYYNQEIIPIGMTNTNNTMQISNTSVNKTELIERFYSKYALRIADLSFTSGNCELFRIVEKNNQIFPTVKLKSSKITVDENRTINLYAQITSSKSTNATLLVVTSQFTQTYSENLSAGFNNISLEFDYLYTPNFGAGGPYWSYLEQTRLVVINGNEISYGELITPQNLEQMNLILLMLVSAMFLLYLFFFLKKK